MKSSSNALLLIVSGPTGSGKTTLCDRMLREVENVQRVITSTTRDMRAGEVDKQDYYFFSVETFEQKIEAGEFYEYAKVFQRYYGTLKKEIDEKLSRNIDLLLNIDVQGAATFRKAAQSNDALRGNLVTVFVRPDSIDEIRKRLIGRGDDNEREIARRLESVEMELQQAEHYDYIIDSKTKDDDFAALMKIYQAEKQKRG